MGATVILFNATLLFTELTCEKFTIREFAGFFFFLVNIKILYNTHLNDIFIMLTLLMFNYNQ